VESTTISETDQRQLLTKLAFLLEASKGLTLLLLGLAFAGSVVVQCVHFSLTAIFSLSSGKNDAFDISLSSQSCCQLANLYYPVHREREGGVE
jgi:hypothetical protein